MKKKIILSMIMVIINFLFIIENVGANGQISSNTDSNTQNLTLEKGKWYPELVGLKIHVVSGTGSNWKDNEVEQSEIFINALGGEDSLTGTAYYNKYACPKSFYGRKACYDTYKWVKGSTNNRIYVDSTNLPGRWKQPGVNGATIDLDHILEENDYKRLKDILNTKKANGTNVFTTLSNDDYIVVEPMVYIGGYYGTAFELLNDKNFKDSLFAGHQIVFGGSDTQQGVLYQLLFESSPIEALNLYNQLKWAEKVKATNLKNLTQRNKCLEAKTCSRGIGVYLYSELGDDTPPPPGGDGPDPSNSCEEELSKLEKTPKSLFNLYIKLGTKYKGLLNFDNPSCQIEPNETKNVSCMNVIVGKSDLNFSDATLEDNNGSPILCKRNFSLVGDESGGVTKSGMLLYGESKIDFISFASAEEDITSVQDDVNATATLTLTCYSPEEIPEEIVKENIRYFNANKSIIANGEMYMDGQKLYKTPLEDSNPTEQELKDSNGNTSGYLYEKKIIANYNFQEVYSIIGSGKIVYQNDYKTICKNKEIIIDNKKYDNVCEYIGKGIVTKFNETKSDTIQFLYKSGTTEYSASCEIQTDDEIVTNGKLNLEFRTVDTSYHQYTDDTDKKVFVGKEGKGRKISSNWCTPLRKKVLANRNNSTNKKNEAPMYTITLTQEDIKDIRKYNKANPYDTQIYCDTQNNCKSEFFKEFTIKRNEEILWEKDYKDSFQYGDVDLDGEITVTDSTAIQKYIIGDNSCNFYDESFIDLADVDADGKISSNDSAIIQNKLGLFEGTEFRLGQKFYK